jgi:hypothetical protein
MDVTKEHAGISFDEEYAAKEVARESRCLHRHLGRLSRLPSVGEEPLQSGRDSKPKPS